MRLTSRGLALCILLSSVLVSQSAWAQGAPTPVGPAVLTVPIPTGSGTVTTSSSVVIPNVSANTQLALFVNIKASPTGTTPTITYTLSEVDPGDGTTAFTGAQTASTAALNAIGAPAPITISTTKSTSIKVAWVLTGTSPSFTQVFTTLTAWGGALNTIQGCGVAGTPCGGVVTMQLPTGQSISVVGTANAADHPVGSTNLSTVCTTTTGCAGTSAISWFTNGLQSFEVDIFSITSPVNYVLNCDLGVDQGTSYALNTCNFENAITGEQKGTSLANSDLVAGSKWRVVVGDNAPSNVQIRASGTSTTGSFNIRSNATFGPAYPLDLAHNIALGHPRDLNGNSLYVPMGGADQTTATTPRELTFASPSTPALATAPSAIVQQSPIANPVCTSFVAVNQTATTKVLSGVSGKKIYFCSLKLYTETAQSVNLLEGTGTTCATGIVGIDGVSSTTPTTAYLAGQAVMNSTAPTPFLVTRNVTDDFCIAQSGAGHVSGYGTYVIQ